MKVMWAGAIMFGGWLWFFMFIRQFLFNVMTAYPMIKKMQSADPELIAIGAKRYTTVSVIVSLFFSLVIAVVVVVFCKTYLIVCFFVGAVIAFFCFISQLSYTNRSSFDTFCTAYCRFVPDDELRTAMYNKKPSQMKLRLHTMGLDASFIPKFEDPNKKNKKS